MEYLGLLLAVVTSVVFGISVSLQKYSLTKMKLFTVKGMITHRIWMIALAIGLFGVGLYVLAMSFAPLSTVQPMLGVSMVIPMVVGVAFFHERQGVIRWLLVGVVITGMALVSLF